MEIPEKIKNQFAELAAHFAFRHNVPISEVILLMQDTTTTTINFINELYEERSKKVEK